MRNTHSSFLPLHQHRHIQSLYCTVQCVLPHIYCIIAHCNTTIYSPSVSRTIDVLTHMLVCIIDE